MASSCVAIGDIFHKAFMTSQCKNFKQYTCSSDVTDNDLIMSRFRPCPDRWAIVTCAKRWNDWILKIQVRVKNLSKFQIWAHTPSVKRVSVRCSRYGWTPGYDGLNQYVTAIFVCMGEWLTSRHHLVFGRIWTYHIVLLPKMTRFSLPITVNNSTNVVAKRSSRILIYSA